MSEIQTWQERQAQLLQELNVICCENNIDLFLWGETALCAIEENRLSDRITVCVDASRVFDLIAAIENSPEFKSERVLESLFNNSKYPAKEIRYCDRTTTDFNINNCNTYLHNCIHITIKIIEHIPTSKLASIRFRLTDKKYRNSTEKSASLFKSIIKLSSNKSNKVRIQAKKYDAKIFIEASEIQLLGNTYKMPKVDWSDVNIYKYTESQTRFRTCEFSWDEYKELIKDVDVDKYKQAREEEKRLTELFSVEQEKVQRCYDIMERTYDRFRLYQIYEPQKEKILELYHNKETKQLETILSEYIEAIDKHFQNGLGLCFDTDILKITTEIIARNRGTEYANAMNELVPEQHLKPLRIKDYKGNYLQ